VTIDLNRSNLSDRPINQLVNELIEHAEPPSKNYRQYLGASSIGSECLRQIQYDWMCDPVFPVRTKDIFERGHFFEARARQHFIAAGFKFAPAKQLEFETAGGLFSGHADGILVDGPQLPALRYPCLWEAKCLKAKSWRSVEREGLKDFPRYAAQVCVYQFYLNVAENPALFTVINADTAERLHFFVPFDAQLAQMTSDRAVAVIEATRAGELLPRAYKDSSNWHCKMCAYRKRCWR
jgi:hypothetical protein